MEFPSELVQNAVTEISKLPGIGKKSALRLVLHLLKEDKDVTDDLTSAIHKLRHETLYCRECHNISDHEVCHICSSHFREGKLICVTENPQDIFAIEKTAQYTGKYHVLGGLISPMDGIGPDRLNIQSLFDRCKKDEVAEVILALRSTMEGETTAFYLTKKLNEMGVKVTTLARGLPIGSEIEYTDEVTLGRSIIARVDYQ